MAFVVGVSLLLSRAFACAMPFVALATFAAVTLRDRDASTLVMAAWLGNQAIGFGVMHYPWTASTLSWGVAIGVAALAAWMVARVTSRVSPLPRPFSIAVGFVGSCLAYELVLFATSAMLPSGPGAFAPAVVLWILAVNAVALALLFMARWLAASVGMPALSRTVSPA